jgi:hypothetical protein
VSVFNYSRQVRIAVFLDSEGPDQISFESIFDLRIQKHQLTWLLEFIFFFLMVMVLILIFLVLNAVFEFVLR